MNLFRQVNFHVILQWFFLLILRSIETHAQHYPCPNVELASFGSDFDIKCNETHLMFRQNSNDENRWLFANPSKFCRQHGRNLLKLQECDVTKKDTRYLTVPLISEAFHESACVYCQINYKPISPTLTVTKIEDDDDYSYTFTLTTNHRRKNSFDEISKVSSMFEILWVKRSSFQNDQSITYWFSPKCISSNVKMTKITEQTLIFTVKDAPVGRVEVFLRSCNSNNCRAYRSCNDEIFDDEIMNLQSTSDFIEKVSCDFECLYPESSSESETQPSQTTETTKTDSFYMNQLPLYILLISILSLMITAAIFLLLRRSDVLRQRHNYTRASQQASNASPSSNE